MNKKILPLIVFGVLTLIICPLSFVSAQLHDYSNGSSVTVQSLVPDIEDAVGLIFGAVVVVCFVVAGIMFLTAGGQPEKINTARDAFLWGVVGVVVGIIAYSMIAIVSGLLTSTY